MRALAVVGCLLSAAMVAVAAPACGAAHVGGVDCARPAGPVARTICGNADLLQLDATMVAAYRAALRRHPDHAHALRQDQHDWLAWRDDQAWQYLSEPVIAAEAAKQLRTMYSLRIEFLRHVFDVSTVQSPFLKHVYQWLMAGGVPGHDLLAAAGAKHAD